MNGEGAKNWEWHVAHVHKRIRAVQCEGGGGGEGPVW